MIIIKNVTEESFFIFDSHVLSLPEMIGYYHDITKQTIRVIVDFKEFKVIQKVIQQSIGKWNSMLDPSNVRVTVFPNLVLVSADVLIPSYLWTSHHSQYFKMKFQPK
jgi:hypothetical protein